MASMVQHLIAVLVILGTVIDPSDGHGRLIKPVGRATMWRYGYKTPPDYNDNQLYCGGRGHQWNHNGGKCGVCGDAYDQPQPRDHEAGGKYGLGIIVERYVQGQVIEVNVELTANHRGNFEFRICDTNHPKIPATEECLNRNLLTGVDGRTKFVINGPERDYSLKLMLPPYLKCSHCVFQWKYEAAQNPGNQQEHFINCADVAIDSRSSPYQPPVQTNKPYIPVTIKPNFPYIPPTQKPYKPYVPPTQKPYKPYVPPTQKPYKPYVPPTQKPYKPYVPPTQKPYKPYVPPTQKPYKPYVPPTQKPYKPYVPPTQKPYKPYVPPTQKPYVPPTQKPYVPPTQKPYKPYVPPTQKPYKPYVPPTQKPYIPPPPNPGTQRPIFPFYPIKVPSRPTTQSVIPPFNIIRPSQGVKICPKRCFLYCQLSIRMCPDICRNCYTLPE